MKTDSKLSDALHVLLHMAQADAPMTSEKLAVAMRTNPVVVRRMMAGLREVGLVRSEKGHGGGWSLERDLSSLTLADIYKALGSPALVAIGFRSEKPGCLVEQAVNAAIGEARREAEALLMTRFASLSLATLAQDFQRRMQACGHTKDRVSHAS